MKNEAPKKEALYAPLAHISQEVVNTPFSITFEHVITDTEARTGRTDIKLKFGKGEHRNSLTDEEVDYITGIVLHSIVSIRQQVAKVNHDKKYGKN